MRSSTQLKVKPRRTQHVQACALELTNMLSCWATHGDVTSSTQCKEAAKRLHECMAKPVSVSPSVVAPNRLADAPRTQQIGGKARVSSINYHLSRL